MIPRRQCLLGVLAGAMVAGPLYAQHVDPISGRWSGEAGPTGAPERQAITLELQLDNGVITGNLAGPPQPGVIRAGSFDPSTGALRLEVSIDGGDGPVVFEGIVVTGTALGRVTGDGITGDFKVSRAGAFETASGSAAAARSGFVQVRDWIARAAAQVSDEQWAFRPVPAVRTFGEVVAHVADSYLWYCARASGNDVGWSDDIEKGAATRGAVMAELDRAATACGSVYESGSSSGILIENVAHANLHYGNIVTYLRLLGLVPPSS